MAVNLQSIINDYRSGMSIKMLSGKYKMTEKQLNDAILKELNLPSLEWQKSYEYQLSEHRKQVNDEYSVAYEKLKSGNYIEALKLGFNATITMFNPPQNPNIIIGDAPGAMKWTDVKSIFTLIKTLKGLPQVFSKLKSLKNIEQFKSFMNTFVQKAIRQMNLKTPLRAIKERNKTFAQLVQEYSKGKNLINMTDEELVLYYKQLIPKINKEELQCLIDQVHRIKNGEQRWLNTKEESDLLRGIYQKLVKNRKNYKVSRQKYDNVQNETAEIPFKGRELTDFQRNQLSGWYNKGHSGYLKPIFEDLGTVLDHDVYLYRCVTVRSEMSAIARQKQCNFLNTIKEGNIINNSEKYTSTAKSINKTLNYGQTYAQSYVLKIKVPKGTKVLDMRNYRERIDEIVLPPSSYKVNKIDYTTGIVDCDFIPQ